MRGDAGGPSSARIVAVAALLFAVPACGSDDSKIEDILPQRDNCIDEPPPEDGKEITILGASEGEVWRPLTPGEVLEIYHGPQGGHHVYASVKFYGKTMGRWEHQFEVLRAPSGLQAGGTRVSVEACTPLWTVTHDITVYIDNTEMTDGALKLQTNIGPELGTTALFAEMPVKFSDSD